jgi:hypothetical protein
MTLFRIIRWFAFLAIGLFVLKQLGVTPTDLWQGGADNLNSFRKDSQQLLSGEAINKVSQGAKTEMKEAQQANPAGDSEMSRELQQERARVVDAKFDALKNPNALKPPAGSLAEQTTDSARKAGGGY